MAQLYCVEQKSGALGIRQLLMLGWPADQYEGQMGNRIEQANERLAAAQVAFGEACFDRAAEQAGQALQDFTEAQDKLKMACASSWLGAAQTQCSEYRAALSSLDQAVKLFNEMEHPERIGHACNYLAVVHEELGDLDEAFVFYGRGLEAAREFGDNVLCGRILANRGESCLETGEFERATPDLRDAAKALEPTEEYSLLG